MLSALLIKDQNSKENSKTYLIMLSLTIARLQGIIPKLMALQKGWFRHAKRDFDAPPSSFCDPKWVQRVGFAKMARNLVPLPTHNTRRGRGVVLGISGLDQEEIKLFGHKSAFKTNTSWLEVILHAFGARTSHGLTQIHKTHHSPGSGDVTTILPIVYSAFARGSGIRMSFFSRDS